MQDKLKLYYMPECPFCKKVLRFMEKNGIEIPLINTNEDDNRAKLEELGGMYQVPALDIDGQIMYESSDIINYFKENLL